MLLGAVRFTEDDRELGQARQHPEPCPAAHAPRAREGVAERRVSVRRPTGHAVHRGLAADVVERMAGSAQDIAGAHRAGVVGLHQQDRRVPQRHLRVRRIGSGGGASVSSAPPKSWRYCNSSARITSTSCGGILAVPPRTQRGLGIPDEARVAFRHCKPKIAPRQVHGRVEVVGLGGEPRTQFAQFPRDRVGGLDRQALQDRRVVLRDVRGGRRCGNQQPCRDAAETGDDGASRRASAGAGSTLRTGRMLLLRLRAGVTIPIIAV